jgi:hypothetical protein
VRDEGNLGEAASHRKVVARSESHIEGSPSSQPIMSLSSTKNQLTMGLVPLQQRATYLHHRS